MRHFLAALAVLTVLATGASAQAPEAEDPSELEEFLDEGLDELLGGSSSSADGDGGSRFSLKGFVELRPRVYLRERNGEKVDEQLLLEAELEVERTFGGGFSAYFRPRLFVDLLDDDLHRFEPYEAYVTWEKPSWDLRLGQMVENWGIVDTYNPLDLVNRRDFATDILDPRRLGELGVRFRRFFDGRGAFGEPTVSIYALPVFRETRFSTENQRFALGSSSLPFDEDGGFEPSGSDRALLALRLQSTLETAPLDADLQLILARGPERVPTLLVDSGELLPVYYGGRTVGAGLRAVPNEDVLGSFLASLTLKLEVVHKSPYLFDDSPVEVPDDYVAYVLGFDRAFYNVAKDQDQLTLTLEYAGEEGAEDPSALLRPFRDDLILRLFWEANDFARTSLELRGIYDLETSERLYELAFATQLRGLHEDLQWSVQLQVFEPPGTGESFFDFFPDNTSLATALRWDF